jgi:protein SCO1/2
MNKLTIIARISFLLALTAISATGVFGDERFPGDSVYQLRAPLTNQAGEVITLDYYAGSTVLVSMFYASCPYICPTLISNIQQLKSELPEALRAKTKVLMISVDPKRDSPAKLMEVARLHGVDLSAWTFASPASEDVREVAAVLGVQYRKLPDGEFNHTTVVILLDAKGRSVAQTTSISQVDRDFLAKTAKLANFGD